MKESRLVEILAYLNQYADSSEYNNDDRDLIESLRLLLENGYYQHAAESKDISFSNFVGFCANRNRIKPSILLTYKPLKLHPLVRHAFDSWRLGYANTETSIELVDILEVPEDRRIVLVDEGKLVCFDIRELLEHAKQEEPACFRSPATNKVFAPEAVLKMEKHPALHEFAARVRRFYMHQQKIDAGILDRLHDLLGKYLELGTKAGVERLTFTDDELEQCSLFRTQFLCDLDDFAGETRTAFLNSIILVGYVGGYQPVALKVNDIFYANKYRCIMVEQMNLWVLLTTQRPFIKFPALLKNVGEARDLELPPGVELGELPEIARTSHRPQSRRGFVPSSGRQGTPRPGAAVHRVGGLRGYMQRRLFPRPYHPPHQDENDEQRDQRHVHFS